MTVEIMGQAPADRDTVEDYAERARDAALDLVAEIQVACIARRTDCPNPPTWEDIRIMQRWANDAIDDLTREMERTER